MKRFFYYIKGSLFLLLLTACTVTEDPRTVVHLNGPDGQIEKIIVEIADEPQERARGLMFRQELENGYGMLFIFDEPEELSFWMKNTMLPLDILFFDDEGVFISRASMPPCMEDPCVTYESEGLARFALEVPAGDPAAKAVGDGWDLMLVP